MGKNVHKIWGWDKKKRTMIRFMKPGDIFCFRLNEDKYCFGRIIAKAVVGHIAEVFDYISEEPNIDENQVERPLRLIEPVVLDSYSLFDEKTEGDWMENVYFTYGFSVWCKIIDVYGNVTPISEEERSNYPLLAPKGDDYVTRLVLDKINSVGNVN